MPSKNKGQVKRDEGKLKDNRNFFEDVFEVVRLIPKGRVTNYGSIAKYLGTGLSSRMVGWAMNASHFSALPVPAHRVVNRAGMLTGRHHFETPEKCSNCWKKRDTPLRITAFNNSAKFTGIRRKS